MLRFIQPTSDLLLRKGESSMEKNIDSYKIFDGKKYLWDGSIYEDKAKAEEVENEYKENDFETWIIEGNDRYLIYSRREVTEVVVEGESQ